MLHGTTPFLTPRRCLPASLRQSPLAGPPCGVVENGPGCDRRYSAGASPNSVRYSAYPSRSMSSFGMKRKAAEFMQ